MKTLALLLLLASSLALANDENFTILVEHYEDSTRPGFSDKALRGRQWDLDGLLRSFAPSLEWTKPAPSRRPTPLQGNSTCLRIRQPRKSQGAAEYRARMLQNLLTQLQLRASEMQEAGAVYQVVYPSDCGN